MAKDDKALVKEEPRPVGRPTSLTDTRINELGQVVGQGNYLVTACRTLGIPYGTYKSWHRRGLEERKNEVTPEESVYVRLVERIDAASATAEERAVSAWSNAFDTDWRAAAEFLARRFPDRWARPDSSVRGIAVRSASDGDGQLVEVHVVMGGPTEAFMFPDQEDGSQDILDAEIESAE